MEYASIMASSSLGRWEAPLMVKADIAQIRRENLKRLVKEHGGVAELSRKLGHASPSYLSQLAGEGKKVRDIGEKTARNIEEKLGLDQWYMDRPPGERTPFSGTDRALIISVVRAVAEELEKIKKRLPPEKHAALVAEVYEHSVPAGKVDREFLQRVLKLIV